MGLDVLALASELKRAAVRARNIKLLVVIDIVQSSVKDEASEDRMNALRKHAEIDSKYLLTFAHNDASELKESLNRHAIISIYLFLLIGVYEFIHVFLNL